MQPPFRRIRESPAPRIAPPKATAIKFKRDFFKVGKTYCVDYKTYERFCKEIFTDKNDPGDQKWQKDNQYTQRQIIPSEFAYDNGNSGSSVIDGIIGKQDTGNGKAGQYGSDNDHQIRKQCFDFFVHKGLLFVSKIVCQ